jgi:hypothetical protein
MELNIWLHLCALIEWFYNIVHVWCLLIKYMLKQSEAGTYSDQFILEINGFYYCYYYFYYYYFTSQCKPVSLS